MTTYQQQIEIPTSGHRHMTDLTSLVTRIVRDSGVTCGLVHVFNVGSTGVITTIEFEPGLERDLPELLDRLIPPSESYGHEQAWHDGNGHSHLQASWLGPAESIPVASGQPILGTWQQIVHLECDVRPRDRVIVVTVTGD